MNVHGRCLGKDVSKTFEPFDFIESFANTRTVLFLRTVRFFRVLDSIRFEPETFKTFRQFYRAWGRNVKVHWPRTGRQTFQHSCKDHCCVQRVKFSTWKLLGQDVKHKTKYFLCTLFHLTKRRACSAKLAVQNIKAV